jgi:hypothetical protein
VAGREILLARTGYTGEDGFELFSQPEDAEHIWTTLSGRAPARPGARQGCCPGHAPAGRRDALRRTRAGHHALRAPGPGGQAGQARRFRRPGRPHAAAQARPRRVLVGLHTGHPAYHGMDIRCCGTGGRTARSPAAPPPPRWACPSPWLRRARGGRGGRERGAGPSDGAKRTGRLAIDIRGREPAR